MKTQKKKREQKSTINFAIKECSLGFLLVAASKKGICAIFLGDDKVELQKELQRRFPQAELIEDHKILQPQMVEIINFIDKPKANCDLALDFQGTVFQERVWQALRKIPLGTTVSYSDIARKIGLPKAIRAVANACAGNHIAILIPCHRVVKSDGSLSGYRWGVERKRILLQREQIR